MPLPVSTLGRPTAFAVLAWFAAVAAMAGTGQDDAPGGLASQVTLKARLSIAGMQEILRQEAVASVSPASLASAAPKRFDCRASGKSVVCRPRQDGGVGADVTAGVKSESLELIAQSDGRLDVSIPIDVTVTPVKPGFTDTGVDHKGCGRTSFRVTMPFKPMFSDAGALQFVAGKVTVDNARYQCRIYTNLAGDVYGAVKDPIGTFDGIFNGKGVRKLADVNVAQLIGEAMVSLGKQALAERIRQVNARLPTEKGLQTLLRRPAAFGSAISLGIDQPQVRMRGVEVDGDNYTLIGSLEGLPRLRFDEDWADAAAAPVAGVVAEGFRVPARLLFPTDRHLLPDATLVKASGCLGAFRLQPVAAREDLAVLQRCDTTDVRNVIWLSGDSEAPPVSAHTFERPMDNVLSEILAWLDEPQLWQGVGGIDRLRGEVAVFRRLVERFQADTTLPIQDRGSLSFRDLGVDLHRLWVTNEAILADVSLVGNATLQLDLMP